MSTKPLVSQSAIFFGYILRGFKSQSAMFIKNNVYLRKKKCLFNKVCRHICNFKPTN